MCKRPLLFLMTGLVISLCSARPAEADWVRVTLMSGQLQRAKLPEHAHARGAPPPPLSCLSLPALRGDDGSCGAAGPAPVDPLARLEIGGRVLNTHPVLGALTPVWDYGMVFDKAFLKSVKYADFVLFDHHQPGEDTLLGGKRVKPAELLRPGKRKLKLTGGGELTYQVELVAGPAATRQVRFQVPAKAALLAPGKPPELGKNQIPVAVGETVAIVGSGGAGKAAGLVAQLGLTPVPVGTGKSFTAETSGLLVVASEGGGGEVTVTVTEPGAAEVAQGKDGQDAVPGPAGGQTTGQTTGPDKAPTEASAGTTSPGGIPPLRFEPMTHPKTAPEAAPKDKPQKLAHGHGRGRRPRLSAVPSSGNQGVRQAIEAHNDELDSCMEGEDNPYGEVVLVFSISASGSMLGVVVEKASPNLRKAGECMRQKALRWRFPSSHGNTTARYPLQFSPS